MKLLNTQNLETVSGGMTSVEDGLGGRFVYGDYREVYNVADHLVTPCVMVYAYIDKNGKITELPTQGFHGEMEKMPTSTM